MSKGERGTGMTPVRRETARGARDPLTLADKLGGLRGVPKMPQGWLTFGLTVMAILIAIALWLR